MDKQTTMKTCPVWLGYGLNTKIRKIIHNPTKIVGEYVKQDMVVADIGTGMGYMTIPMAQMVGEQGKVIAVDIQKGMLDRVHMLASHQGVVDRIENVLCRKDNLMLEDYADTIAFALMFMMVHEVSDKQQLFIDIGKGLMKGSLLLIAEPKIHVSKKNFEETTEIALRCGFKVSDKQQKVNLCRTIILEKR